MSTKHAHPVAVLGVPVDNVTMEDVVDRIQGWIEQGSFHQIATANTDFLINSVKDEELSEILRRCDLVMADGMPLVWTSKLIGTPLKGRVTGADLVPKLVEVAARCGYRLFLLGATEQSLDGTMAWIGEHYPKATVVGRYSPKHAPLEGMNHDDILTRIHNAKPDILLVAFGNPKQEKWISMHRHRLEVPVCVGVGASFDFLAGAVTRAPGWMQRGGLEWLYRAAQEPKRLGGRYFRNACGLVRHLPGQLATYAVQGKQPLLPQLVVDDLSTARILRVSGDFSGPVVARFEEESLAALSSGSHLVLDLSRSSFIGPDALGLLIRISGCATLLKREFWLTGLKLKVQRAVHGARLGPALRIAQSIPEAMRRMEPAGMEWKILPREWAPARLSTRVIPFTETFSSKSTDLSGQAIAI